MGELTDIPGEYVAYILTKPALSFAADVREAFLGPSISDRNNQLAIACLAHSVLALPVTASGLPATDKAEIRRAILEGIANDMPGQDLAELSRVEALFRELYERAYGDPAEMNIYSIVKFQWSGLLNSGAMVAEEELGDEWALQELLRHALQIQVTVELFLKRVMDRYRLFWAGDEAPIEAEKEHYAFLRDLYYEIAHEALRMSYEE